MQGSFVNMLLVSTHFFMPEFSSRPPPEKQACKGQSDGRPCDEIVKGREPGVEDISGVNLPGGGRKTDEKGCRVDQYGKAQHILRES